MCSASPDNRYRTLDLETKEDLIEAFECKEYTQIAVHVSHLLELFDLDVSDCETAQDQVDMIVGLCQELSSAYNVVATLNSLGGEVYFSAIELRH